MNKQRFSLMRRKGEGTVEDTSYADPEQVEGEGDYYDNDLRNKEIIYHQHGDDPFEVMRILNYDDSPMAKTKDEVVIKVEASTVSLNDCYIRENKFKWKFGQKPTFPIVPGMDLVGIVISCGSRASEYDIQPGDKVAALVMHGCNAKYRTLQHKHLLKVPDDIDSGEAVSMIRTYTEAFQALMQNVTEPARYSKKPLNGKRILIVGPCGNFERAMVELSLFLGAKRVYFSSTQFHDMYIRLLGAKPLGPEPEDWVRVVKGKIDIAIDSVCDDRYEHSFAALNNTGILIATGMSEVTNDGEDIITEIEKAWTHATVALSRRCTYYHGIVHAWNSDYAACKKDLTYLYKILDQGKIRPKIAARIPLTKVPITQERLVKNYESMERRGVFVVEPWKVSKGESTAE